MGRQRFDNDIDVERFVRNWVGTQPQTFFEEELKKLLRRWKKYVDLQGEYVQ